MADSKTNSDGDEHQAKSETAGRAVHQWGKCN